MLNIKMSGMALMLLSVGLLLVAGDKAKAKGKAPDSASEERTAKIVAQLTGKFGEMATAVKLNEKQAKEMLAFQTAMNKALAKWDQTNEKRIASAEAKIAKTKNAKIKARLDANLKRLKAGRGRLEAGYNNKALSVLTPLQRGEYFGPKLWSAILREFDAVNFDEAQEAKALKICKDLSRTATSDPTTNRSLKARARKNVTLSVLTKEQKKKLRAAQPKTSTKTVPGKTKRTRNK